MVHFVARSGTILPSLSSLTSPSYTLSSRACGMAAPSVLVKSRLAGSATRPTVSAVLLASPPPPLEPPLLVALEPAEQPAAVRTAVSARARDPVAVRVSCLVTVSPSGAGQRVRRGRRCGGDAPTAPPSGYLSRRTPRAHWSDQ